MSCDYTHRCECKHERVRYCAKCKVVHCLDCKMEWKEQPTWTYSYGSYPYIQQPYQWINRQGSAIGADEATTLTSKTYPTHDTGIAASYTHFNPAGESISLTCSHQGN